MERDQPVARTGYTISWRSPRPFLRLYMGLAAINLLLIAINAARVEGLTFPFYTMNVQFDLTRESNLAVWFSSSQLLLCSVVAFAIGCLVRVERRGSLMQTIGWFGMAILLMRLSADEVSMLHEWAGERFAERFGSGQHGKTILKLQHVFNWLLALVPLILIAIAGIIYFIFRCLREHALSMWLAAAGLVLWITVLMAEAYEARQWHDGIQRGHQATVEESAELLGGVLFFVAFVEFFRNRIASRQRSSASPPPSASPHGAGPPKRVPSRSQPPVGVG